ncbi:hypothetical protein KDAU_12450 [Dictyobacter aurantiacus]|uniref:Uncharacterized protein n=1 Tax=Dictyobacter aurantiacus TaxID=1936993 RepID=A0A401ZAT2_9CHLR|nr:hypothetical protein KDAU_12450 [Dictyobacter aurantiacus]
MSAHKDRKAHQVHQAHREILAHKGCQVKWAQKAHQAHQAHREIPVPKARQDRKAHLDLLEQRYRMYMVKCIAPPRKRYHWRVPYLMTRMES